MLDKESYINNSFQSLLPTHTLKKALEVFAKNNDDIIPVINDKEILIGILTKSRVIKALVKNMNINHPIEPFVRRNPICISPQVTYEEIRSLFIEKSIIQAPVINSKNQVIGIMSLPHIFKDYQTGYESIHEKMLKDLPNSFQWKNTMRNSLELADDVGLFDEPISCINKEGDIILVNKAFCKLLSANEGEILEKPLLDIIPYLPIHDILKLGLPIKGLSKIIGSHKCLIDIIPIKENDQIAGAMCRVIHKAHIEKLYFSFEDNLPREYANKLNTMNTSKYFLHDIIGNSEPIQKIKQHALSAAPSRSTILLIGESGTGKELFAHGIHAASSVKGPLIKVNCAAIPEDLLESEFFGYEEGAFTGARKGGKEGKFKLAQNGTLFLDEIGDMPLALQTKLLRVLQEKEFEPVGSNRTIQIKTRIIVATNQNLEKLIKEKKFREDLYYRINILPLHIPPLRERKEDLPLIIQAIIKQLNGEGFTLSGITPDAMSQLINYSWPGNVRELHNVLERGANLTKSGYIDLDELPSFLIENTYSETSLTPKPIILNTDKNNYQITGEAERKLILNVLMQAQGNKTKASDILGKSRTWLYKKLKEYNIE